jgi:hypothetical protein
MRLSQPRRNTVNGTFSDLYAKAGRTGRALAAAIVLLSGTRPVRAQARPDTATIEFIGLKRWSVEMIRDTMAVRAPGQPLGECAVVLQRIGFPSASSAEFDRPGSRHIVVTRRLRCSAPGTRRS